MSEKKMFMVPIENPMLYDRINTLAAEYSVSVAFLVDAAVKRLMDDVDFVRALRMGTVKEQ